MVHKNSKTT